VNDVLNAVSCNISLPSIFSSPFSIFFTFQSRTWLASDKNEDAVYDCAAIWINPTELHHKDM
jgi:hypothetical protein